MKFVELTFLGLLLNLDVLNKTVRKHFLSYISHIFLPFFRFFPATKSKKKKCEWV